MSVKFCEPPNPHSCPLGLRAFSWACAAILLPRSPTSANRCPAPANPFWPGTEDPQERCFPDGPVRAALWTGVQIEQYPGYVLLTQEANHTFRVVPLDGRPRVPQAIKLWMSDSRGHWEGTTLVIDITNSNAKGRLDRSGNFASDQVHIVERYTFGDKDSFDYRVTFEDATVYTRPWTLSAKFLRNRANTPDYETWEQECQEHENNTTELSKLIDAANRPKAAVKTEAGFSARQ